MPDLFGNPTPDENLRELETNFLLEQFRKAAAPALQRAQNFTPVIGGGTGRILKPTLIDRMGRGGVGKRAPGDSPTPFSEVVKRFGRFFDPKVRNSLDDIRAQKKKVSFLEKSLKGETPTPAEQASRVRQITEEALNKIASRKDQGFPSILQILANWGILN